MHLDCTQYAVLRNNTQRLVDQTMCIEDVYCAFKNSPLIMVL